MKPKDALVKDGFLPEGSQNKRGRLSGAAIDRCKELATQGWTIDGYTVSAGTASGEGEVQVTKTAVDPNRVADIPNPTRDETALAAFSGTVKVGMRTVCNNCRRSLTYCPCEQPRVWLDFDTEGVVYFKPKG